MKSIFHLFSSKVSKEYFFTLVDVGAMGGIAKKWDVLSDYMKIIAFEPDEREFHKLKNNDRVTYFNSVLYEKSQDLMFYVSKGHGKSSIYKPNIDILSNFEDVERFHIIREENIPSEKVKSLDSIMEENSIKDIDFIKLDTQGSELGILKGAQKYTIPKTFGMHIEAEFLEMYKNQPLFRDIDEFVDKNGFQLIDLRRAYFKRKCYYDYVGKGQLIFGDALYFKKIDVLSQELHTLQDKSYGTSKIYKAILVCLIYRMFDYAVSVAQVGFELGYFSQSEYKDVLSNVRTYSHKGVIPNFPGKSILYKIVNLIARKLRPKSYLGWADGDWEIGNIKDL